MGKIIIAVFLLLLSACRQAGGGGDAYTNVEHNTPPASTFTASTVANQAGEIEWKLKEGQQGAPVQVISCILSKEQVLELKYRNVSAEPLDGVRMVLLAYDNAGAQRDFAEGSPYRYVTDQQELGPQKSASFHVSLQDSQVSRVVAYVIKVHYTSGGSWENH